MFKNIGSVTTILGTHYREVVQQKQHSYVHEEVYSELQ